MFAKTFNSLLLCLLIGCLHAPAQIPIGTWRAHLNYQNALQVVQGDKIYCGTSSNIFSVDADGEINTFDKTNGLSETGVSCIGWDEHTQQLVIAYKNSNVDILKGSIVQNISDIKQAVIIANKSIQQIYCKMGMAYLATGLGIIAVDLTKYEVKETWIIGSNGAATSVHSVTADDNYFYAATNDGLKRAAAHSLNLADYKNWGNISISAGLTNDGWRFCGMLSNQLVGLQNDSVVLISNPHKLLYYDPAWKIISAKISNNQILLTQKNSIGTGRVMVIDGMGKIVKLIENSSLSSPNSAIFNNTVTWVADEFKGLIRFSGNENSASSFTPNGPGGIPNGDMVYNRKTLFIAAGSVNNAWNALHNKAAIYTFTEEEWVNNNENNVPALKSFNNIITLAVDPADESIWAGSFGDGLVQMNGAKTTQYTPTNSALEFSQKQPNQCLVSGLLVDDQHNLWVSNYGAAYPLKVRKNNGVWVSIPIPLSLTDQAVAQLLHDDFGQLWMVSPKNNGLICYQYGKNIDQLNDDRWKLFSVGMGNGNLPSNHVLCIAKDKSNTIWVGTDNGIGIIQCTDDVFGNGGCNAVLPVVQQEQFTGYLFKGEQVQCIAVDGADQKWVGTKNGVWLLSADGEKIIHHFTESNSPLLNNEVNKIGIDPQSGEVFFATSSGLCSYRSTITAPNSSFSNLLIYPNPVPTDYNGLIGIKGLTDQSIIKITELNGRLVFQTRCMGGQATWNGRDYTGNKIASGVYLVLVTDESGTEKVATKIIVTRGR
jgi:hypothetical protein